MNQATDQTIKGVEPLLRIRDVADILRISDNHLRKKIKAGEFMQPLKVAGVAVWRGDDIRSYIANLTSAVAA
jgi:predicted DNA-binding transcriptional regulator AlpA